MHNSPRTDSFADPPRWFGNYNVLELPRSPRWFVVMGDAVLGGVFATRTGATS
ncbi:MAG TPA: hypothetical protein VGL99_11325 [Chloroflexota bacterium]